MFDAKSILITGGTGSFGTRFVRRALDDTDAARIIVFSRDECKQHSMREAFDDDPRLRWFIGDVRDKDRLYRAMDGVDVVVHAAAMKQVPACEYNPLEAIKTNILGASNLIDAAIDRGVGKILALSTDKACNPVNLYGATKLCADKLFVAANHYSGSHETAFSLIRYGNVFGSRGSVVPTFVGIARQHGKTVFPVTNPGMTRFWISLDDAVSQVMGALQRMEGGETFVPIMRSSTMRDLAMAIDPDAHIKVVGLRPGEKLHETIIPADETGHVLEFRDHFTILPPWTEYTPCTPTFNGEGILRDEDWAYTSENCERMTVDDLQGLLQGAFPREEIPCG